MYIRLRIPAKNIINEEWRYFNVCIWPIWKLAFSIKLWGCRLNAEHIDYKTFLKLFSACTTVIFSNILQLISLNFFQVTILILDEFYCFIFLLSLTFSYKYLMCFLMIFLACICFKSVCFYILHYQRTWSDVVQVIGVFFVFFYIKSTCITYFYFISSFFYPFLILWF